MQLLRYLEDGVIKYGVLQGAKIKQLEGDYLEGQELKYIGQEVLLAEVRLLSPVTPSKVVCVGLNYAKHIEEMNHEKPDNPKIFLKPSTSVIGPEDDIIWPEMSSRVDYEGELAVVIGSRLKDAGPEQALESILGYTCANDVTARDLQRIDGQWTRAKSFDTFCPIGPWIETDLDISDLQLTTTLNGNVKQSSSTKNFLTSAQDLIVFISQVMTLEPGDVILTGTPEGVGAMADGDKIAVSIENIGELKNRFIKM